MAGLEDDFAFQPATTSVLGDLWRNSNIYKSYGKYGKPGVPLIGKPKEPNADEIEKLRGVGLAQATPASFAPAIPTNAGVPTADLSRNVSPDRYDPAIQARGQRNAFEQPLMEKGYQPTSFNGVMYKTQGGQTEYQQPKGSMTFQGGALGVPGRQGGGTLSVLGGRTAGEQTAIDDRVAEIDKQTAALRSLNNATRQKQGLPTIEQEQEQNSQLALVNQVMRQYGDNPELAMSVLGQVQAGMKNRSAAEAGAYQAQQEQSRWEAEQKLERQKTQADQADKGYSRKQKDQEIELERQKLLNPKVDPVQKQKMLLEITKRFITPGLNPDDPPDFQEKAFADYYKIPTISDEKPPNRNEPFFAEEDGGFYILTSDSQVIQLTPEQAAEWALQPRASQGMKPKT